MKLQKQSVLFFSVILFLVMQVNASTTISPNIGKDISSIIEATAGHFDAWFLGDQPGNTRAAGATEIAALLDDRGQTMVSISKNLRQALRRAQSIAGEGDRLVVFGSFYTVAAVLPLLDKDHSKYEAL